ncbi:MAG: TPM domain-containing protein [Chitinophagaceae bacterium]
MPLLSLFTKKPLLSEPDKTLIVDAIRIAEQKTSGEIRVYIESRCKFVDPLDRAAEVFYSLKMEETEKRNAVLVYVAIKDKQLALFADEGIYQKAGAQFWQDAVKVMLSHFNASHFGHGISYVVTETGNTLKEHFPYNRDTDKNELPDDIVFGK